MTTASVLPDINDCIDLYLTAYDQSSRESFTMEELDLNVTSDDTRRLLDLAVAYGFLTFDGTRYSVRSEPSASADRWEALGTERARRVHRALSNRTGPETDVESGVADTLMFEGKTFISAFVTQSDDFEAVADTIASTRTDDHDGVVLRSQADFANEVQRFADRLCDQSDVAETSLSTPLQKESSDVAGNHKDNLEFRLFLRSP